MSAIATAVIVSTAAFATSTVSSYRQSKAQERANDRSFEAQQESERQARDRSISQERRAAQADRKANRKQPDVAGLLFSERAGASRGRGSTILGGDKGRPLLGQRTPLL